jgi:hypothetical protein
MEILKRLFKAHEKSSITPLNIFEELFDQKLFSSYFSVPAFQEETM